jgi:hypothetical protein
MDLDGYPLPVDALIFADADADGLGSSVIAVLLVSVLCLPIIVPPSAFQKHLCRVFAVLWIRIRIDSQPTERWDPDQKDMLVTDPDPHQSDMPDPESGSASICR